MADFTQEEARELDYQYSRLIKEMGWTLVLLNQRDATIKKLKRHAKSNKKAECYDLLIEQNREIVRLNAENRKLQKELDKSIKNEELEESISKTF